MSEWDFVHFLGVDGTGGGGHHYASAIPDVTKFPVQVETLDDLQRVQDSVLRNVYLTRYSRHTGTYVLRGLADIGGIRIVVDIVIDPYASPVTLYPVNGDFVRKNDAAGHDMPGPQLDVRALRQWRFGE